MDIVIRGVTFPAIDLLDADTVEAYEAGLQKLTALKNSASTMSGAQFIRDLCDTMRDWLDEVIGEGAGESALPVDSMRDAFQVMRDLIQAENAAKEEIEALWKDFNLLQPKQETMSRRERRAAKQEARRRDRRGGRGNGADVAADPTRPYDPERIVT